MPNLLDDDSGNFDIKINQRYAKKYEQRKQREELSALQDKYSDDEDSSDDEPEDEVGELVTPAVDAQFVKTIALLKKHDPTVYDSSKEFFSQKEIEEAKQEWLKKKKDQPLKLKDYHRKNLLEKGSTYLGEEEEEETPLTFTQEQELAKQELKKALETQDDDDDLFTVRPKTDQELEKEEEDYKEFLLSRIAKENKETAQAIRDWTSRKVENLGEDAKLEDQEAFLWDYILNRGWMDKQEKLDMNVDDLSEDEEDVDEQDDFERRHNFRFEEEGGAQIVGHARNIEESLRRKDNRRKEARERKKQREEESMVRKTEEIKRLKNLKKKEILDKVKQIQEISGAKALGFEDVDLEEAFDPEKHDQIMAKTFDDSYYEEVDEDGKPIFADDIDIGDIEPYEESLAQVTDEADDAYPPVAEESGSKKDKKKKKKKKEKKEPDFIMDADYLDQSVEAPKKQPPQKSAKVNEMLEELHQLDYEDIVGDQPVRFKYRQVKPDYHELEPWEILLADDKDLNEIYSLKKIAPYRGGDREKNDKFRWNRESNKSMYFFCNVLTSQKELKDFRKRLENRLEELDQAPSKKRKRSAPQQKDDGSKKSKSNDGNISKSRLQSYGL